MTLDKLSSEMVSTQKEVAQINIIVERLETAIAKITDVSSTVSRLLAVQDNKIDYQEKTLNKLANDIFTTQKKIVEVEADLERDIDKFQEKLLSEIADLRKNLNENNVVVNNKINGLEKKISIAIGGGIVVVFIMNQVLSFFVN
jgi:chromosome segregation ATPase